jgi:hypothetical protein
MSSPTPLFPKEIAVQRPSTLDIEERARLFCTDPPHRRDPFARRNWGGSLHSLCSYQGKLKPAIGHFLVDWFTEPGDRVVDLMAGVGTIPLEARRLGRSAIANDLSPLAYAVATAKLLPVSESALEQELAHLAKAITDGPSLGQLESTTDVEWGLNGPIRSYFHPDTLREILIAREHFRNDGFRTVEGNLLVASVMHILHGNRPYALSRRSHPVTPFKPQGDFEYRSLLDRLSARLSRVVPELISLAETMPPGESFHGDFRHLELSDVDAVITSPPFAKSLRFWSSNWMRLWFAGWEPPDFKIEPARYVETEQRKSYEVYSDFAEKAASMLKPDGLLVLHLGETRTENMVDHIRPLLEPGFRVLYSGREEVGDTESHGLSDKGSTTAHWYLFAQKV